jgi:Ca2+-binding EF-hand superfamily protein
LQNEETFLLRSFKFFDFKNSGEVDFPTFQKAIAKIGVLTDESDLFQFFQIYDSNGNGSLDYKEFVNIVFGKSVIAATPSSTQS